MPAICYWRSGKRSLVNMQLACNSDDYSVLSLSVFSNSSPYVAIPVGAVEGFQQPGVAVVLP